MATSSLSACSGDNGWWGQSLEDSPCELDLVSAVETTVGDQVANTDEVEGPYETTCVYELSENDRVSISFFHADRDDFAAALRGPVVWTPGSTPQVGYQGPTPREGGGFVLYLRAVDEDAAVDLAVELSDVDQAEIVPTGEQLALEAVAALLEHR